MRLIPALSVLGAIVLLSNPAGAESRLFVIANAPDAYGVDQCLATGAQCGALIANSYCQSQAYLQAASFRRLERADITGSTPVPDGGAWPDAAEAFVAIECTR